MEIRHLIISGNVQRVGFRWGMVRKAGILGASGWVRNRSDGTVEAMVAGSAETVAEMIAWARHGPRAAEVTHVAVELGEGEYQGFEERPSV